MSPAESPLRASPWEWAQTALLSANLVWTTLGLGGYRPETMLVTLVMTGATVVVHAHGRRFERRAVHPAGWWLLPFAVYALANVLWITPVRWLGWMDWFGWVNGLAVFWIVLNGVRSRGPRRVLFFTLIGLAVAAVLLACHQRFVDPKWLMLGRTQVAEYHGRSSGPFGIPNSLAAFLLLLLPASGWLACRRGASGAERVGWGWVALVVFFGFVLTISRGGWIALGIAFAGWPLLRRERWSRKLGYSAVALATTVLLAITVASLVPKARERFIRLADQSGERSRPFMWRAGWAMFESAPVFGTGAGSYNVVFEKYRPEGFLDEPQWAHNEYLNTLSDYGLTGFGLGFVGIAAVALGCARRLRSLRPERQPDWTESPGFAQALLVGLIAFVVQIALDFHLKIPALAMTSAALAGWVIAICWPQSSASGSAPAKSAAFGRALAALVAIGVAVVVVPRLHGEAQRYRARQQIDQIALMTAPESELTRRLAAINADLKHATELSPANGQAWADLSYAAALHPLVESGRNDYWGKVAEEAADRALALSQLNAEFWVRRGIARDLQGRWLDAGNDFVRATELAPRNAWMWFYQAEHLSRRSTAHGLRDAALAFCLRLDPGNRAGLALRQRLAISQSAP